MGCDLSGSEVYRACGGPSEKYLVPGTRVRAAEGKRSGSLEFLFRKKSSMEPHARWERELPK